MFKNPRFFPAAALVTALALLIGLVALINSQKTHTPENVIEGTVSNFQDAVLKSPLPVYVEFYVSGPQCKPCIAEDPIVAKLATEYKGKVRFVRVDAMKNPQIAQAAGITGVPTHFFLKPAEQIGGSAEGFLDETQLRAFIEAGLKMQKPAPAGNGTAAPNGSDPADQAPAVDPTKKDGK